MPILSRVGQRCPHCGAQWSTERTQDSPKANVISSVLTVVIGLLIVAAVIYTPVIVYKTIKGRKKHKNISQLLDKVPPSIIENHIRKVENSSLLLRQDGAVIEFTDLQTPNHNGIWLQTQEFSVLVFPSSVLSITNTNTKVSGLHWEEFWYSVTYLIDRHRKTLNAYELQRPRQIIEGKPYDDKFGERVYISFDNILYFENSPQWVSSHSPLSNPIDVDPYESQNDALLRSENLVNAKVLLNNGESIYLSRFNYGITTRANELFFFTKYETDGSINYNSKTIISCKDIESIEFLENDDKKSDSRLARVHLLNGENFTGKLQRTNITKTDSFMGVSEFGWTLVHIDKIKRIEIELPQ